MRKATVKDADAVIAYLRENRADCLYMYINACHYGMDTPDVVFWLDDYDGAIQCVLSRYYNCFRLYCNDGYDRLESIAQQINEEPHTLVYCSTELRVRIEPLLASIYQSEVTYMMRISGRYRNFDFSQVKLAREEDVPEIVQMLDDDPFYAGQCEPERLKRQMIDRMRTGMGCTFILRDGDGRLAATDSIMAQAGDVMIASQFLCRADMRKKFVAETMENYIIKYAADAGKELYAPLVEERRIRQFEAYGGTLQGEMWKMIRQ